MASGRQFVMLCCEFYRQNGVFAAGEFITDTKLKTDTFNL